MAIDLSAIYSNPLIDPDHYFARVVRVQTEDVGALKPRLQIDLILGKNGKDAIDGTRLTAILHPTDKSMKHFEAFESAFGVANGSYQDAEGEWAMIYARENLFKGTAHSIVKFHKQTKAAKKKVAVIEAEMAKIPVESDFTT